MKTEKAITILLASVCICCNQQTGNQIPPRTQPSLTPTGQIAKVNPVSEESIEYKLATINKGTYIDHDDITVARFRYLLDSLERKTTSSKEQIGDMTVNAQRIARDKYGKEVKLLDLMEGANRAIPEGNPQKLNYAEIVTMVMTIYVNS